MYLTRVLFLSGLLIISKTNFSQLTISGKITTEKLAPLSGTSVTLCKKGEGIILAFAISNRDGKFTINYSVVSKDSFELKTSLLGYVPQYIYFLQEDKIEFNFLLLPQAITLKEVKLKTPPVWQRKDTINYNASEFKQQQDRVIGDIIARLPGIEVSPNGQIKYNGKPINKYYIEGLDLLEDKYSLANSNIPMDVVDKVQILENHQPIRLLDSISFSDRAALNIKLKNTAKTKIIGRARVGLGASPMLSEDDVTPMLFKKNLQFINTYKYNNTGLDNARELSSHNILEYINALQNGAVKKDLVSIVQLLPSSFSSQRYLLNNAHLASLNVLIPLKQGYQLRINTSYVNDCQKQQNNSATKFYLLADTVTINEQNNYSMNQNKFQTDITLMANTAKFYLKNNLQVQSWRQSEKSMVINNEIIDQQLSNPYYNIANDFKLLKTRLKLIMEIGSYMGYVSLPQYLTIRPGLYANQLNNNISYDGLHQKGKLQILYTDNYISIRKRKSKFSSQYKIGFNIQNQEMISDLQKIQQGIYQSIADTFQNNLEWRRYSIYANNSWSFENNKIRLHFSLPFNFIYIDYSDRGFQINTIKKGVFVTPVLSAIYQLSPMWNFNSSASFSNGFGDISGIASGYILKTYRNLANNKAPLSTTQTINLSGGITFRNPLKIIFFNSNIAYSHIKSNLLYRQLFNGSLESLIAMLQDNYTNRITVSGRMSKYVIGWKVSFGINYGYSFGTRQLLQRNSLVTYSNKNYSIGIKVSSKLSNKITSDYAANYFTFSSATQLQKKANSISSLNQDFSINYFPTSIWMIRFVAEHYYFNSQFTTSANYFFGDIDFRYKPKKSKIDYEISFQNLFNTKTFTTALLLNNIETVSGFQLRPRQFLFKINFSF